MNENERQKSKHLSALIITSIAGIVLIMATVYRQWEMWMIPIILIAMLIMWFLHITQHAEANYREQFYTSVLLLLAFFHGVHHTSFFDISIVISCVMITLTYFGKKRFLNFALIEFVILIFAQVYYFVFGNNAGGDDQEPSRIILHLLSVILVYMICMKLISDKIFLENAIRVNEEDINRSAREMEDVLVNISNDFSEPINTVMSLSESILREKNDERVAAIYDASEILAHGVDDIKSLTEIKEGTITLKEEKYDLDDLVSEEVETFGPLFEAKGLKFITDVDDAIPRTLSGDRERIKKVIKELLDNGLKYTHMGRVIFSMGCTKREYGINLDIVVEDTGGGMSREEIERLNDGFYQIDKKREQNTGGIGIGYSIIYGYVHEMEGFIKVESVIDHGTKVRVSIPQAVGGDGL